MKGSVLYNLSLEGDKFLMGILAPELAKTSRAGQFVMLRVSESLDPLLRRPFSFYSLGKGTTAERLRPGSHHQSHTQTVPGISRGIRTRSPDSVEFLYRVVGQGTRIMAHMEVGREVDLLGPLGNPFPLPTAPSQIFLIAGGIGIAPLLVLMEDLQQREPELFQRCKTTLFFGGRRAADIVGVEDFQSMDIPVRIATEDGSLGQKGLVTDLLTGRESSGEKNLPRLVYTCGPHAMMAAVARLCRQWRASGYASLECLMGCGFGACLGCVVKSPSSAAEEIPFTYRFVCKEGPTFPLEQVLW